MRLTTIGGILLLATGVGYGAFSCGRLSSRKDADTSTPASAPAPAKEEPQIITISGTVALASTIPPSSAGKFQPGAPLADATVFVRDFPEQTAKTDATGAFVLALDLGANPEASLTEGEEEAKPEDYRVVLWKATDELNGPKFGVIKDLTGVLPGEAKELGQIDLGFTSRAIFLVSSKGKDPQPIDGCSIGFPGYEERIKVAADEGLHGHYSASYLPPAEYQVHVDCPGFQPQDLELKIDPSEFFDDKHHVEVSLEML